MFGSNYNDYRKKLGYNSQSIREADWVFYKTSTWKLKFAWLPHSCCISNKIIWLQYAYRGTAHYRVGDLDIVTEHRWHEKLEHIIWELKR